jgi:hypothetical protein
MQFDTKIAVVLRDDLAVWKKTNVTAFLVSEIPRTGSGRQPTGTPRETSTCRCSSSLCSFTKRTARGSVEPTTVR